MKWTKGEDLVLLRLLKKAHKMAQRGSIAPAYTLPDGTWKFVAREVNAVNRRCWRTKAACRRRYDRLMGKD